MARIYLAVGHGEKPSGGHDPGAVGNGWSEQSAGDIIVAEAAEWLRTAGHTVRDEANQKDPNYVGTAAAANAWSADVLVTVHHDWSGSPLGAHGFYHTSGSKAAAVGQIILADLEEAGFPVSWDHFRARPGLYVLSNTVMPAFLLEAGRIGSPDLDSRKELEHFGRVLAHALHEAYSTTVPAPDKDPDMASKPRHPEAWEFADEIGLRNEHTDPLDPVEKDELFEFLRRYDRAVIDTLTAEVARLSRQVAEITRGPVAVDEADIAARIETRIRASLKESL